MNAKNIFQKIFKIIFYNPYRFVKSKENIDFEDSSILTKTCSFRFDTEPNFNFIKAGKNNILACEFIFEKKNGEIYIGDNCFINGGTRLISINSIHIGNNVTISWDCTIYDHNSHSLNFRHRRVDQKNQLTALRNKKPITDQKIWDNVKSKPIRIEDDVWIGFGCIILGGVTIGNGAIIGAGSVVREDIEPWSVVIGNPARVISRLK